MRVFSTKLLLSMALMSISMGMMSQSSLAEAIEISQKGQFAKADSLLSEMAKKSTDPNIIRGLAFNYSWWGYQEKAIVRFKSLIKKNKKDITSKVGLGYSYLFDKQYANAYLEFKTVLNSNPNHEDAKKGMAYTFLNEQNYSAAYKLFNELSQQHTDKEEYKIALAKVLIAQNKNLEGAKMAETAVAQHPQSNEAQVLVGSVRKESANLEVTTWGSTAFNDNKMSYGLRLFQANYILNSKSTISAKLDNSLATDNYSLFTNHYFAPTLWLGGMTHLSKNVLLFGDIGNRFMDGLTPLIRSEVVYFAPYNFVLKSGLYTDLSPHVQEYSFRVGVEAPISKSFRLGSTYFYSKDSRFANNNFRWLINSSFSFNNGSTIDVGYFFGNMGVVVEPPLSNVVNGLFFMTQIPVSKRVSLLLLGNYEKNIFNKTIVTSAGVRVKIL